MSRRFQFSLGQLMVTATLLSVAIASASVLVREVMSTVRAKFLLPVIGVFLLVSSATAAEHTADSLETVKKKLAAKKAVLVDVREKSEWEDGHLENAMHAPLSELKTPSAAKRFVSRLPEDKIVYTHCASGVRSVSAAKILRTYGVDVRPLKSGYDELIEAGFKKADGTASPRAEADTAIDELLGLMRERLLLMHEVARWKWNEGKPIADPKREKQLLADLEKRGLAFGLTRGQTSNFMAAQMEAGKLVQQADFAKWKDQDQGKFSGVRDLNTSLRPLIAKISDQMLAQFKKVTAMSSDAQPQAHVENRAKAVLAGEGIDDDVRATALRPLLED